MKLLGFLGGSDGKESACGVEDLGSISGSERSPGEGNGNPVQYSCLGNPMDRGAWVSPWGLKESDMSEVTEHLEGTQGALLNGLISKLQVVSGSRDDSLLCF